MPKLIIQRTNEYNNRLRDYGIYIDGVKVDTISNGQSKEFDVSPGRHTLLAKIDWCSSPEVSFDIMDNGTKTFKVGGFKHGYWAMPLIVAIMLLGFFLERAYSVNYILYMAVPAFLVLIYFFTLGRKQYLTLSELI